MHEWKDKNYLARWNLISAWHFRDQLPEKLLKYMHIYHTTHLIKKNLIAVLRRSMLIHTDPHEISPPRRLENKRVDESHGLTLDGIRDSLIRQEDSIIFSLLERAQYAYNPDTYDPDAFGMDGFHCSLIEFMLHETERLHALVDLGFKLN